MGLLNLLLAVLTAWSLGYLFVRYREYDYQRYYPLVMYIYLIYVTLVFDLSEAIDLKVSVLSFVVCLFTVLFTHDPLIGRGYKIYGELPISVRSKK